MCEMMKKKDETIISILENSTPADVSFAPVELTTFQSIPFTSIASLGSTSVVNLVNALKQGGTAKKVGETLYRAVDIEGNPVKLMFEAKKGASGLSSGIMRQAGRVESARFREVVADGGFSFDPTMLFMSMALVSIEKSVNEIKRIQTEIASFMRDEKRSELTGNIRFLNEILNDYKYNLDNETYRTSMYIKLLDIRQTSEQSVDFFKMRISDAVSQRSFLAGGKKIEEKAKTLADELKDYQASVYIFSFSYFLEAMLGNNFNADHMKNIMDRLEETTHEYMEIYTHCYDFLQDYLDSSIRKRVSSVTSDITAKLGGVIGQKSHSKSKPGETMAKISDMIESNSEQWGDRFLSQVRQYRNCGTQSFLENMRLINHIFNGDLDILVDENNIYFN